MVHVYQSCLVLVRSPRKESVLGICGTPLMVRDLSLTWIATLHRMCYYGLPCEGWDCMYHLQGQGTTSRKSSGEI